MRNSEKTPSKQLTSWLSLVVLKNDKIKKFLVLSGIATVLGKEYSDNHKHYNDAFSFNFCNGFPEKTYKKLFFYDLPEDIKKLVAKAYTQLMDKTNAELYAGLGLASSVGNSNSPLETKYVYNYFKKYGTLDYKQENKVSVNELMTPLSKGEQLEYSKMF